MKYSLNNFKIYILAVFTAITISIVLLYPALPKLNSSFIGDGGDNYEYASYTMLFKKNISEGHFPFEFTNYWRYPVGFDFERSFDSHLTVILGGTLNYFISSPLSYNLTIIFLMALNGIFSFIFFKYLTGSKALALLGMIMYGFSFYTLAKAEAHPNLLFIGGFPLLGYSILRIIKEQKINLTKSFLFFFSLFLIALGSKEYFLLAILFLIIYLVITTVFYKNNVKSILKEIKNAYKLIAVSTFAFLIALSVVFFPYISAVINGTFYLPPREDTLFTSTPSLIDYLIPNRYLDLLSNIVKDHSRISIESMVFIGWIELLIFVLFFINRHIKTKFKLFILSIFLIPLILSFGYGEQNSFPLLPYRFLKDFIIFRAIAETNRYFVVFYLILSSTVVLTLATLKSNKRIFAIVVASVVALLLLERFPLKIITAATLNDSYTKIVQKEPGTAVLDLPINIYYPGYNVLSFYYNKPLVNGYFHWSSDGPKERSFLTSSGLMDYYCNGQATIETNNNDALIKNLKNYGITTIVIHKDKNFYYQACKSVRIKINSLFTVPISLDLAPVMEKQVVQKYLEGKASFNFYFPQDGVFYLDGVYIAPSSNTVINIALNNQLLPGYAWSVKNDYSMELLPKYSFSFSVKAGSMLSLFSSQETNNTYFSMWYRYKPDRKTQTLPYEPLFQKIFEDATVEVYQLKQ